MNPVNFKLVEGRLGLAGPSLPCTDGLDIAGVVSKVGKSCKRLKPGDKVWGKVPLPHFGATGSFAEYALVPENCLDLKPDKITFKEAAGLGVVVFTGYQALIVKGGIKPGQKILILGGSGGTGTIGIQIAKHICGAYVATTCSERNIELVRNLGADKIINYREENWSEVLAGENYDFIYDCVGGETHWADAQKVLNPNTGHFLTITGDFSDTPHFSVGKFLQVGMQIAGRKIGSFFGGIKYDFIGPSLTLEQFKNINQWLVEKKLRCLVDKTYPFDKIYEAYDYQHSGRAVGKVIVVVKE